MRIIRDYQGVSIRLTAEGLAHILEHPEMVGLEMAIQETLTRPEKVIESMSDPQRGFTAASMSAPASVTSTFAWL
jgi:hypothetical protein